MPPQPHTGAVTWVDDVLASEPTARRAPSVLNSQPVVLRRGAEHLEVCWDPARTLSVLDPDGDQLWLSLGAFVEAMVLAAAENAVGVTVEPSYDPARHRFAVLRPGRPRAPRYTAEELRNRVSGAGRFAAPYPSLHEVAELARAVELPAGVRVLAWEHARADALAEQAHRWLFGTPEPRRELRAWVRPGADDGIEPEALGLPPWRASLFLAAGGTVAEAMGDVLGGHPRGVGTLAALVDDEGRGGPVRLGVLGGALLRLGLQAIRHGLRLQSLPHLTACPATRDDMARLVAESDAPGRVAAVVRVGVPEHEPPLSRRRPTPVEVALPPM